MLDCSTYIDKLVTASVADHRVRAASNLTDQSILDKNSTSNQSSKIREIKKLTSEEVQLIRNLSQGFSRTATQSQFAALGIFLLGISLIIYG